MPRTLSDAARAKYARINGRTPPLPLPPRSNKVPAKEVQRRAAYRRDVLGLPGPADKWIATIPSGRYSVPAALEDISKYDVKCRLEMIRTDVRFFSLFGQLSTES